MISRLRKQRRWLIAGTASVLALVLLLVSLLYSPSPVLARDIPLSFTTDSWENSYSKHSTLAPDAVTIPAEEGMRIKRASVVDWRNGNMVNAISEATGQTSWSGRINTHLNGIEVPVFSKENRQEQGGYYAWYRYSKGSRPNDQWYATSITRSYDQGRSFVYEDAQGYSLTDQDEFAMPAHPNYSDSNLWMKWTRSVGYTSADGTWFPASVVSYENAQVEGATIEGDWVSGPDALGAPVIHIDPLGTYIAEDMTTLSINFAYTFNHLPVASAQHTLPAYGAKVMAYHYKFTADIESVTYLYPYKVVVEYEPIGGGTPTPGVTPTPAPSPGETYDLSMESLTYEPNPFTVRNQVTFTYVMKNNSAAPVGNFWYKVERGSTMLLEERYTGTLQPGATLTRTFTRSFTSAQPVSFTTTVNSRNTIEETNYANNSQSVTVTPETDPDNKRPVIKLEWFLAGQHDTPVTSVIEGARVDLVVTEAWDPEGDAVTYETNFIEGNSWIRSLPGIYGFDPKAQWFPNITADAVGYHSVDATITDSFGAYSTSDRAFLQVDPANPIPVITGPASVVQGRSLPDSFSSANSYSPVEGRTIDHSKDQWGNLREVYHTAGTEIITLDVTDSAGLQSLPADRASHTLTVIPDLPPVGKLEVQPLGIRGQTYAIINRSYSPDGDQIVDISYRYKYDKDNNGFHDDPWQPLAGDMTKVMFTPDKVGQYLFDVQVIESHGMGGRAVDTQPENELNQNIINLAPTVSFAIQGENPQPEISVPTFYSAETIANDWTLYNVNSTNLAIQNNWVVEDGSLRIGLGRNPGRLTDWRVDFTAQFGGSTRKDYGINLFADHGFGINNLSPFRSMQLNDSSYTTPLLVPKTSGGQTDWEIVQAYSALYLSTTLSGMGIQNTDTHMYFIYDGILYGMNKTKLSKAEYKYEDMDPDQGYRNSWKEGYPGGNPYDLIIRASDFSNVTYAGVTNSPDRIIGHTLSDRTLFVTVRYKYRASWDDDYDSYREGLHTYDLFTGEKLGENFGLGTPTFTYQDIAYYINQTNSRAVDRYAHIIKTKSALAYPQENYSDYFQGYEWRYTPVTSAFFQDLNGDFYRYVSMQGRQVGSSDLFYQRYGGTWIQKFDKHFNIVWTTALKGQYLNYGFNAEPNSQYNMQFFENNRPEVFMNPITNEIIVRSMFYQDRKGSWNDDWQMPYISTEFQKINMETGQISDFPYEFHNEYLGFSIDWQGNYINHSPLIGGAGNAVSRQLTRDGRLTMRNNLRDQQLQIYNGGYLLHSLSPLSQSLASSHYLYESMDRNSAALEYVYASAFAPVNTYKHGMYIADGMYLNMYSSFWADSWQSGHRENFTFWITSGTASTNSAVYGSGVLGQFISPDNIANDTELSFNLSMETANANTQLAGMSFRIQNSRNRYAVETDGKALFLSKYVNGNRTVLNSISFPFQDRTSYNISISMEGNRFSVSLNGVPYLNATDNQFANGKFGPFSDKSHVMFSGISVQSIALTDTMLLNGYAIWDEGAATAKIAYKDLLFTDPEEDPRAGSYQWSYQHTPKFLNNQGLSALNGQFLTAPEAVFDKVGIYTVSLQARDDPHPNYRHPSNVFDEYRQPSNVYSLSMTVHRRPVALFTLQQAANGTVTWNDQSYDPDRYDPATGMVSPPDTTGYNYGVNRGIIAREYAYVSPSGAFVQQKLVSPQEAGTYTVYLRVQDEYGAWSYPYQQTMISGGGAPLNRPPVATLTYPNGTQSNPALQNSTTPTIQWQQTDPDPGTIFRSYNVRIIDESGAVVGGTGGEVSFSTSATNRSWIVSTPLTRGEKYQVQVQVSDGQNPSAWSNIGWMVINSKPSVTITSPGGAKEAPALILSNRRPTIQWTQSDPERNQFQKFYIEVRREDGTLVWNTGWNAIQNTTSVTNQYTVPISLPTGEKLQARMQVTDHDVNMWSDWSNTVWFKINFPPAAVVTYPSGSENQPTMGNPLPLIQWKQTDPDPNTVFTAYQLQILSENGATEYINTGVVGQNTSSAIGSYQVMDSLPTGEKVQIRVRVWDQDGIESPWSPVTWMLTNRPPVADFDWSPKPVFEGDTVSLINQSYDPDGQVLNSVWKIVNPSGIIRQEFEEQWTAVFSEPGIYQVQLEVTDGFATDATTKEIAVLPLTIEASVNHTPLWLQHHQQKGHETETPPKEFYSGEQLLLELISAPAPVQQVEAWLNTVALDGTLIFADTMLRVVEGESIYYHGELDHIHFRSLDKRLPNGEHIIHFKITYANGTVKEQEVPIRIIGSVHQAVQVHRIQ